MAFDALLRRYRYSVRVELAARAGCESVTRTMMATTLLQTIPRAVIQSGRFASKDEDMVGASDPPSSIDYLFMRTSERASRCETTHATSRDATSSRVREQVYEYYT